MVGGGATVNRGKREWKCGRVYEVKI